MWHREFWDTALFTLPEEFLRCLAFTCLPLLLIQHSDICIVRSDSRCKCFVILWADLTLFHLPYFKLHMQLPGPMKQQNTILWICPVSVHAAEIYSLQLQCKVYAHKKMFYARRAASRSSLRRGSARSSRRLSVEHASRTFFFLRKPFGLTGFQTFDSISKLNYSLVLALQKKNWWVPM